MLLVAASAALGTWTVRRVADEGDRVLEALVREDRETWRLIGETYAALDAVAAALGASPPGSALPFRGVAADGEEASSLDLPDGTRHVFGGPAHRHLAVREVGADAVVVEAALATEGCARLLSSMPRTLQRHVAASVSEVAVPLPATHAAAVRACGGDRRAAVRLAVRRPR